MHRVILNSAVERFSEIGLEASASASCRARSWLNSDTTQHRDMLDRIQA